MDTIKKLFLGATYREIGITDEMLKDARFKKFYQKLYREGFDAFTFEKYIKMYIKDPDGTLILFGIDCKRKND